MSKILTPEDVKEIKRLRSEGVSVKKIAEKYKVAEATVYDRLRDQRSKKEKKKSKESWPEWKLWDNMHKRYGKKTAAGGDR